MTANRPARLWWRVLLATALCLIVVAPPATASAASGVIATFKINGKAVTSASESHPIKLDPDHPAQVELTVTNQSSAPVEVAAVALSGRALDITFFNFETQTALLVQPGRTETQVYTLDFAPLRGQGDGLIPASIRILGPHRAVLAKQGFTADVQGRITSLFGLFAIEVALFTVILFVGAVLALARGRLPENRFRRALRFLWPAFGAGLVVVFGLAIMRVFVPRPGRWLPIVLIFGAVGFVAGYFTPNPAYEDDYPEPDPPAPDQPLDTTDPRVTVRTAAPPPPVPRDGT